MKDEEATVVVEEEKVEEEDAKTIKKAQTYTHAYGRTGKATNGIV